MTKSSARTLFPSALISLAGLALSLPAFAQAPAPLTPHQQELRSVFKELIEINTTDSVGSCTQAAKAMGARLKSAGFADSDMQIITPPGAPRKGNLIARLKGSGAKKPLLLLAHIDVVEAKREDWERDPFKLVEENGFFYARGAADDKSMAAAFTANMMRYKREKYVPQRDLILALTCDEELGSDAGTNGVDYLIKNHRPLIDAELGINEGGGGSLDKNGKPITLSMQAGEKIFQSFVLETTNPGGHSSQPKPENAIYQLVDGLARLARFDFPFRLTPTTRAYFDRRAAIEADPAIAADMRALLKEVPDMEAFSRLHATSSSYNATTRTTCVATMLDAGHADNALPQRARATVNCRILPGESVDDTEKTIKRVLATDKIRISRMGSPAVVAAAPPLTPALMKHVEELAQEMYPGVTVIPTMSSGATDGRFLNNAGIWTYGVSGMLGGPEGSFAHGLNERIRVKTLYDGSEFLYRLTRRLAD